MRSARPDGILPDQLQRRQLDPRRRPSLRRCLRTNSLVSLLLQFASARLASITLAFSGCKYSLWLALTLYAQVSDHVHHRHSSFNTFLLEFDRPASCALE